MSSWMLVLMRTMESKIRRLWFSCATGRPVAFLSKSRGMTWKYACVTLTKKVSNAYVQIYST
jgi:hypothetical protein